MIGTKFRHFDTRLNEMRYSDKHDGEFYINTKGVLYMYAIPKSESELGAEYYKSYDVEQSTGLKDKNGVEIYEGDIIKLLYFNANNNSVDVVIYDAEMGFDPLQQPVDYDEVYASGSDWEVVGNIHQNPELLK